MLPDIKSDIAPYQNVVNKTNKNMYSSKVGNKDALIYKIGDWYDYMAEIDARTEGGILRLRALGTLFKKDLGDFIENHFSLVESSGC